MLVTLQDQRVKTPHTTISSFSKSSVHTGPQILPFAILIVVSLYIYPDLLQHTIEICSIECLTSLTLVFS